MATTLKCEILDKCKSAFSLKVASLIKETANSDMVTNIMDFERVFKNLSEGIRSGNNIKVWHLYTCEPNEMYTELKVWKLKIDGSKSHVFARIIRVKQ